MNKRDETEKKGEVKKSPILINYRNPPLKILFTYQDLHNAQVPYYKIIVDNQ